MSQSDLKSVEEFIDDVKSDLDDSDNLRNQI